MAKIKRYQIEATIDALKAELKENQTKLNGLMALKGEGVMMLMYQDENGDNYPATIDKRISVIEETVEATKQHLKLFKKLLESQYC